MDKTGTKEHTQTLFLTGGHLSPALAVIDALRSEKPDWNLFFVGRPRAFEGDSFDSEEFRIIRKKSLRFLPLDTGRFSRENLFPALRSLSKVPFACIRAYGYVRRYRPDCILSFGGYVALPVVLAARLGRVPVITHEQTRAMGLANKLIGNLASHVLLSFPGGQAGPSGAKTMVVGLPLRKGLFHPPLMPSFSLPQTHHPLLYVTGGTTGAVSLNEIVAEALPKLLERYTIIHQTGQHFLTKARQRKDILAPHLASRYVVARYFDETDIAWIYHHANLVIGRSGANTVGEIAALGKNALFIPLPWSGGGEQEKNAELLVSAGTSEMLSQETLTPDSLTAGIDAMFTAMKPYRKNAETYAYTVPRDAAERIVAVCYRVIRRRGAGV
ncbi:UDP-N-acetylglucosamine--N-acetylmuramyl-(pentapeptide) pyrophosphoryl-undecaprenol N-acetylglucosamine transferase [Patescibacteria group bacterium]|nr:UDP-N-acetylglucosamine--N-acetylmuramyl-(pentapeptide) pyrophosphoryl-undecaprenol N-acetylglucosamine transferase [Patescibacteria group bacterium]